MAMMVSGTNSCVLSFFGFQGVEVFQGRRVLISVAGPSFLSLLQLSAVHLRKVRDTRLLIVLHEAPYSRLSPRLSPLSSLPPPSTAFIISILLL